MKASKISPIHERALRAADGFRRAEAELLEALRAVEDARVFEQMGHASLFLYATQELRLTEAVAYAAIQVMRKAREVPELREKIVSGELSVSTARKIVPVLKSSNQEVWLRKATELTSRRLEKEVARENPRASTPERAKYVSGDRLDLQLGVDESLMLKLRRAQDLVSGAIQAPATLEATLEVLTEFYLRHKDPVRKAERVVAKKRLNAKAQAPAVKTQPAPTPPPPSEKDAASLHSSRDQMPERPTSKVSFVRTAVPAAVAHAVRLRDQGQCQAKQQPGGKACGSRRWTELHHLLPVAQGGRHELTNLITLCSAHHARMHSEKVLSA